MRNLVNLVAIVVTYNRLSQLQQTVRALLDHRPEVLRHLIVVNNASTDGTGPWLATVEDSRLQVETLSHNRGGAGGFAHGMQQAQDRYDPDWIVVMDDDARPAPGALSVFQGLASTEENQKIDAFAAAVRHPGGTICRMNRPTRNPFWHPEILWRTLSGGGRAAFHLGDRAYDQQELQPIDGASFVGLFLSRQAIQKAGFPDPDLFLYADDAIYTLTLAKRGGKLMFAPQIAFEHDTTSLAAGGIVTPVWKAYYYHRNRLLLYRLAAGVAFWLLLPLLLLSWPRLGRRYPAEDRPAFRRLIWRAFGDAVRSDLSRNHSDVLRLARPDDKA